MYTKYFLRINLKILCLPIYNWLTKSSWVTGVRNPFPNHVFHHAFLCLFRKVRSCQSRLFLSDVSFVSESNIHQQNKHQLVVCGTPHFFWPSMIQVSVISHQVMTFSHVHFSYLDQQTEFVTEIKNDDTNSKKAARKCVNEVAFTM